MRLPIADAASEQPAAPDGSADALRPPPRGWAVQVGTTHVDGAHALVVDPAGDLIVAGVCCGARARATDDGMYGGSLTSFFVAKLDPDSGAQRWLTRVEGVFVGFGNKGLAVDADGAIYITGRFASTIRVGDKELTAPAGEIHSFVAKLDARGKTQWAISAKGSYVAAYHLAADTAGSIYLVGGYALRATFGAYELRASSARDVFIARLDSATGKFRWAISSVGGTAKGSGFWFANGYGAHVAVDGANNAYVVGMFDPTIRFGKTPALAVAAGAMSDTFIVRVDPQGKVVWATSSPVTALVFTPYIAVDAGGTSYIASTVMVNFKERALVVKISPKGTFLWSKGVGGTSRAWALALRGDALYITGRYTGKAAFGSADVLTSSGDFDAFVAKVGQISSDQGTFAWASSAGGAHSDTGSAVALGKRGSLYVTGAFDGAIQLQAHQLTARGARDGFVWKIPSSDR